MIRAEQLALHYACPVRAFDAEGRCHQCNEIVQDLSAMTEARARRFLAAHAGQRVCIGYRVGGDQRVRFKSAPRSFARVCLAAVLTGVMGCTSWGTGEDELVAPEPVESCHMVEGPHGAQFCAYDDVFGHDHDEADHRRARAPKKGEPDSAVAGNEPGPEVREVRFHMDRGVDPADGATYPQNPKKFRANFKVDPDDFRLVGIIVPAVEDWDEAGYPKIIPFDEVIERVRERREQRRERREERRATKRDA